MATTTTSTNDASGIVWAIGVFFFLFFGLLFLIVHPPTLNHMFRLPATYLNTPSMHFETYNTQTTCFSPHRPNEGHQWPMTANDGQHRPNKYQQGPKVHVFFFLNLHFSYTDHYFQG